MKMTKEMKQRIERIIGALEDAQEQMEDVRRDLVYKWECLPDEDKDSDEADRLIDQANTLDTQFIELYDFIDTLREVLEG